MQIITLIISFFKVAMFFGKIWKEKDSQKAAEKAELGKEVINAFSETDKKVRASKLNRIADHVHRL